MTPSSCDLDIEALRWSLQVTESKNPNILPTFSFTPSKTGTAKYQVDVTFVSKPSEASQLSFTYKYLSAYAKVPINDEETTTSSEDLKEATKTTKAVIAGVITGGLIAAVAAGATTVLWSIISFQQFVGYFIYINIKIPYHVEFFLSIISASLWDYLPNPLDHMTDEMYADLLKDNGQIPAKYQPPAKFQEYYVIPFFIKNGGTLLITNLILLLILLLVLGLKKIEQLKKNRIFVWMKVALKWTIIARTFLENAIPLSLSILLQLRIMDFDNLYLAFCSGLSIISAILVFTMATFLMRVLEKRDNTHLEKPLIRRIYGTLYEGIQLKGSAKYYNLIILFRGIGFVCILVLLDASPLIQIIYTIFYNVFLIYYMFKAVALEDFKLNIIVRIKEILILLGEICMLLLSAKVNSEKFYDVVGWIMIGALGSGVLLEAGYMLISQIFSMRATYRRILNIYYSLVVCIKGPDHDPQKKKVKVLKLQAREKGNLNEPSVIQMSESTFGNTSEIRVFRK